MTSSAVRHVGESRDWRMPMAMRLGRVVEKDPRPAGVVRPVLTAIMSEASILSQARDELARDNLERLHALDALAAWARLLIVPEASDLVWS